MCPSSQFSTILMLITTYASFSPEEGDQDNVNTHRSNSSAEVSLSRQSVGFIYKRVNRRADDSFHAVGEQITGNPLQLPSRALIRCHGNKAALLRSDHEYAFSPQLPMRGPQNLIEGEFEVRR